MQIWYPDNVAHYHDYHKNYLCMYVYKINQNTIIQYFYDMFINMTLDTDCMLSTYYQAKLSIYDIHEFQH